MGESAGGHLALMAAYADDKEFTNSNPIDVKYVIGVYPPSDLQLMYEDKPVILQKLESAIVNIPEFVRNWTDINQYLFPFDPSVDSLRTKEFTALYSPVSYLTKEIPNTLIIHGDADQIVPISQSEQLKKKMDARQIPFEYHVLSGVNHALFGATPKQKAQTQDWILNFIERQ